MDFDQLCDRAAHVALLLICQDLLTARFADAVAAVKEVGQLPLHADGASVRFLGSLANLVVDQGRGHFESMLQILQLRVGATHAISSSRGRCRS